MHENTVLKKGLPSITVHRLFALTIFLVWACVVSYLAWNHVVFRDEVHHFSQALQGDSLIAMLKSLHGEGAPAVWFLLLRGAHALIPRPEVLQIVAFLVAFAAMLLLVLRSPFGLPLIALILSSRFALFEYSVMARDYGISMPLLFLIAMVYKRHRDRGVLLGVLLLLLANCNSHSILLVGSFLLFWFVDIILNEKVGRTQALRTFFINASIAIVGIALCVITIYPTFNDAIPKGMPDGSMFFKLLLRAVFLPADGFRHLLALDSFRQAMEQLSLWRQPYIAIVKVLMSLLMFGSTLVLIRRPAAMLAAVVALIGLSLFFTFIYGGGYRHEALWLVFLISLYWIVCKDSKDDLENFSTRATPLIKTVSVLGYWLFIALLALQIIAALPVLTHTVPESRSRDLGLLITRTPALHDAIVIADPDVFLEPLSYYVPNRTYLMRERRFGNFVIFTKKAILQLSLGDILTDARELRKEYGKPVIILLQHRLDPSEPAQVIKEGFNWEFSTTPEQVRTFLASTRLIERFGPVFNSDETFDVYVVD